MSVQHLYNQSKAYSIIKKYVELVYSVYYSKIHVINLENGSNDQPIILGPNHQNGLMDALAVGLPLKKQPVFMARADIFSNKKVAGILNFFKIVPVFRIRDGVEKMSNNDQSFAITLKALSHGQPVVIMPEGTHQGLRRLKPIKKGIVRFALNAQENFGRNINVKLVPVGIDYSHYHNFRGKLLVIYGKPIEVSEYLGTFRENPQIAYNQLRNRLAEELRKIMIDVDNPEYYQTILTCRDIYVNQLFEDSDTDYYQKFLAGKALTDKLDGMVTGNPSKLEDVKQMVSKYSDGLDHLKLEDWVMDSLLPDKKTLWFNVLKYLMFLPFFIGTAMINIVPAAICKYLSKKSDDPDFESSFKIASAAVIFPLFYLLVLFALPLPVYTRILLILPMPVLLPLAYDYYLSLKKQWIKIRYFAMMKRKSPELASLKQLRDKILRTLDDLLHS